jgi:ribosomal protein L40E
MERLTGNVNNQNQFNDNLKFCKFCGQRIPMDAVICVKCGRQVEELKTSVQQPNIIINNDNSANNSNTNANINANINASINRYPGRPKSKFLALLLCFFLGYLGAHKFYEGKVGMGIFYFLTMGFFFIGIIIDFIVLLGKPSTYYV